MEVQTLPPSYSVHERCGTGESQAALGPPLNPLVLPVTFICSLYESGYPGDT